MTDSAPALDRRARRLVTSPMPFSAVTPNGLLFRGVTTGLNEHGLGGRVNIVAGDQADVAPGLTVILNLTLPHSALSDLSAVVLRVEPSRDPEFTHFLAVRLPDLPADWQTYLKEFIAWHEEQHFSDEKPRVQAAASSEIETVAVENADPVPMDECPFPDLRDATGSWYLQRLEVRLERLAEAASEDGIPTGTQENDAASPTVVREAYQLGIAARQAGCPEIVTAVEELAGSEPGGPFRDRLDRLQTMVQNVLATRPPARGLILLVEPSSSSLSVHRSNLSPLDAELISVSSLEEARYQLAHRTVHLLVLDLGFPDDLARKLLAELATNPAHGAMTIVTVAGPDDPRGEETMAEGAEIFFRTPVYPESFRKVIATRLQASLKRLAQTRVDALTELASRGSFCEELERNIGYTLRTNRPLSMALLEVAGLDAVYREHGRATGDALVGVSAEVLRSTFRSSDLVARWSGGVFAAAFPNTSPGFARRAVEKAFEAAALPVIHGRDHREIPLRFHAGIAGVSQATVLEDLVARTLFRVEEARAAGPGQVRLESDGRGDFRMCALVADNDPLTRDVIAHRFLREGYEVDVCTDGMEAIESVLFGGNLHTCFVIDLHLPRINGLDLVRRLRAMGKHTRTPILLLAVAGQGTRLAEGLALGANDYMTKPFSPLEMMTRMRRLMRPV